MPWVIRARISDSRSVRPSPRPGQSRPLSPPARPGGSLTTSSPGVHRLQRGDELAGGQRLGQVAVHALLAGGLDQVGVEVPGVDDHPRARGLSTSTPMCSWSDSGWAKQSYSTMSTVSLERLVGVDLGDDHPVAVVVEDLGDTHQHDVVVVDQGHGDGPGAGRRTGRGHGATLTHLGVYRHRPRGHEDRDVTQPSTERHHHAGTHPHHHHRRPDRRRARASPRARASSTCPS